MKSEFDGNMWQMIGWQIVCWAITLFTFGIAYPWGACFLYRWEAEHSIINGKRLKFTGTGGKLFFLYLKLYLGLIGIILGISVLIIIFDEFAFMKAFLALCFLAVLLLFGSYALLRITRWRVENTEFEYRDFPPQRIYEQQSQTEFSTSYAPAKSFDCTSKDMVRAEAMSSYVTRFEFNFGLTEKDCSKLFTFVERAVSPDVEVVSAFIAKKNGTPCACAMAISKLIIADDWETRTIQTLDISGFTYENWTLTVKNKADDIILSVSAQRGQAICDVCNQSLIACKKEIESNSKVNV